MEVMEVMEVRDSTPADTTTGSPSLLQTGAQLLAGPLLTTEIKLLIEKRILYVVWLLSAVYTLYI